MPRLIILVMTQLYYVATEPNLHWRHARKKARGSGRSEKSRRHRRQKCFKAALVEIERIALGGIAYRGYSLRFLFYMWLRCVLQTILCVKIWVN